jgi:hypothetical protein
LATVEELELERAEEALDHRVVVRVADRTHRGQQPGVTQPLAEHPGRLLGAVVGVHDRLLFGWATPPLRHIERVDDELG